MSSPQDPGTHGWEDVMVERLKGRGRRESIIIVAEGATDRAGNPISSQDIADAFKIVPGEDARITILSHVQRVVFLLRMTAGYTPLGLLLQSKRS